MNSKILAANFFALLSISIPAFGEITNIGDLPKVNKETSFFDYPWSRPIMYEDNFMNKKLLLVADISTDYNFLGTRRGLISFWTLDAVSFQYCGQSLSKQKCVNLNGSRVYVKVDDQVFELTANRIGTERPYEMPLNLREAILSTNKPLIVRVNGGSLSDKEIGIKTVKSLQEISDYMKSTATK
jgi:hypothetical protein